MLIYELSDNSYRHGYSTEFKILATGNRIELSDNGNAFNVLNALYIDELSTTKNARSYVLNKFKEKYINSISFSYKHEDDRNIITMEIGNLELPIKPDYYEFKSDKILYCGRHKAKALAQTIPQNVSEIVLNIDHCGLSALMGFVEGALERMIPNQSLLIYVPRGEWYQEIEKRFMDERLHILQR